MGVLDLVQDGRIIDFKTVGHAPSAEKATLLNGVQVATYALLYRENTGQKEVAVELHHLVKLKQPRLVIIDLPPAKRYIEEQKWDEDGAGTFHIVADPK